MKNKKIAITVGLIILGVLAIRQYKISQTKSKWEKYNKCLDDNIEAVLDGGGGTGIDCTKIKPS